MTDTFTKRNCNLANLRGMFQTCLNDILGCLENADIPGAKRHIKEAQKSLDRLKKRNGCKEDR